MQDSKNKYRIWITALVLALLVITLPGAALALQLTAETNASQPESTETQLPKEDIGQPMTTETLSPYVIRQGDTLTNIAKQFGITLADILKANPKISNPYSLIIGQTIEIPVKIPVTPGQTPSLPGTSPTPVTTPSPAASPAPVTTPTPAASPAPTASPGTPSSAASVYEREVVDIVNRERASRNLPPLTMNEDLIRVARIKSQDMIDRGYFAHESPTYGSPFEMLNRFGVTFSSAAENIAYGQRTPDQVVTAWMNSEGHRRNILSPNFTQIGVGYAANASGVPYWTQLFIKP